MVEPWHNKCETPFRIGFRSYGNADDDGTLFLVATAAAADAADAADAAATLVARSRRDKRDFQVAREAGVHQAQGRRDDRAGGKEGVDCPYGDW